MFNGLGMGTYTALGPYFPPLCFGVTAECTAVRTKR